MFRTTQFVMGALILAFLFMIRPPILGGTASYITVQQADLEPLLYEDDLAIVRQQAEYQTGELVAVETQRGPYFGRILAQQGEIFQVRFAAGEEPVAVSREYSTTNFDDVAITQPVCFDQAIGQASSKGEEAR